MLKLLRFLLYAVGLVVLVLLSVDNRQYVPISFWPLPFTFPFPVFGVFLVGLFLGAILGSFVTWVGGYGRRVEAKQLKRKVETVEQQEQRQREAEEAEILETARRRGQSDAAALPAPGRG